MKVAWRHRQIEWVRNKDLCHMLTILLSMEAREMEAQGLTMACYHKAPGNGVCALRPARRFLTRSQKVPIEQTEPMQLEVLRKQQHHKTLPAGLHMAKSIYMHKNSCSFLAVPVLHCIFFSYVLKFTGSFMHVFFMKWKVQYLITLFHYVKI